MPFRSLLGERRELLGRSWALALVTTTIATLAAACVHRPTAQPTQTVDLLTFVIGNASMWPRFGTQAQDQIVDPDKREVCWVKYRRPSEFECWRWDDRWIYHAVDHAVDGRPGESYRFSDGRWMPRYLRIGEAWNLDVQGNAQTWLTPGCTVDRSRSHVFPYQLRVSWAGPQDLGADLGVRDVLVLDYGPHGPGERPKNPPERFYFARGAGWFAWTSDRGVARFDKIGGPRMTKTAACG